MHLCWCGNTSLHFLHKGLSMLSQSTNKHNQRILPNGKIYQSWIGRSLAWFRNTIGVPDRVDLIDSTTKMLTYSVGNVSLLVFLTADLVCRIKVLETYTSISLATTSFLLSCKTLKITGFADKGGTTTSKTFQKDALLVNIGLVRYSNGQKVIADYIKQEKPASPIRWTGWPNRHYVAANTWLAVKDRQRFFSVVTLYTAWLMKT